MKKSVIILLLIVQAVSAQVIFEAKTAKDTLALNEKFRVEFIVNSEDEDFIAPNFMGFNIVAGPYMSMRYEQEDGNSTYTKTYAYILRATKRGEITIGPATIVVNGATYTTAPLMLRFQRQHSALRTKNEGVKQIP
jgi:hypothetical protein